MKITQVTIHYSEKQTGGYQAAESGLSITVELGEGESPMAAITKYRPILRDSVTQFNADEMERLVGIGQARDARILQEKRGR